jgi:C4-type Zn-finger protein
MHLVRLFIRKSRLSLNGHSPTCEKNLQTHISIKVVAFETNVSEMLIQCLYKTKNDPL